MKELTMIKLSQLHSHPKNPRKNIGDITELAESIKKNGLMQNLTVIPGHWDEEGNFDKKGYTVVIGHRRLAAATEAGLKQVPCHVVVDMDEGQQVATMLEENMQREDLTYWEEGQGFQMLLDLGQTKEDIKEKTGFSESTIYHRLNIAKLDPEIIQEKEADDCFQLTLKDLYELEKIKDVDIRNEILKEAKTSEQLKWKIHSKLDDIKREERTAEQIAILTAAGVKKCEDSYISLWQSRYNTIKEILMDGEEFTPVKIEVPEGADYYYINRYRGITVFEDLGEEEKDFDDTSDNNSEYEKNRKLQADRDELLSIARSLNDRTEVFISEIISGKLDSLPKDEEQEVKDIIWNWLVKSETYIDHDSIISFLEDHNLTDVNIDDCEDADEYWNKAHEEIDRIGILNQMLIFLQSGMDTTAVVGWKAKYNEKTAAKLLSKFYILGRWGWVFGYEEERLINGNHDLYNWEDD